MQPIKFVSIIPLFLVFTVVQSAKADEWNCKDPYTQAEMNHCSYEEYKITDKRLNQIWSIVSKKMHKIDDDYNSDLKGAHDALLSSQRAWINYKSNHCVVEGFAARGGTLEPLIVSQCLTQLTQNRTKELEKLLKEH